MILFTTIIFIRKNFMIIADYIPALNFILFIYHVYYLET